MGFYYGPSKPPEDEKEPGGCMEALILTRAAFGALAVPLAILFGSVIGLVGVAAALLAGIAAVRRRRPGSPTLSRGDTEVR